MSIISTVSEHEFMNSFTGSYSDNFSYEGKKALYNYLWDLSEDIGEHIELDSIAICCEYTEYKNLKEFQANYGKEYESLDNISYNTTVIELDGEGFIVQDF